MKKLIEEAKNCDNCLDWHKHCNAECCKLCDFNTSPHRLKEKGKYLVIRRVLRNDLKFYYKLRGIIYDHGLLKIEKEFCEQKESKIVYTKPCFWLTEDLKCSGHPNRKPEICKVLNKENLNNLKSNVIITNNCLFKYKKK